MSCAAAPTEARTALLIGNSGYSSSPLINPRNDARDLGAVLKRLGFEVVILIDQNEDQMTEAIFEFGDRLRRRGGVGFFYYGGHGMEVGGQNYLIPVGADIPSERYVKLRGVSMGEVTAGLANARNRMNIVVLDACRNNPFARSWRSGSRGLAPMDAPAETLIAYATKPGSVAADGVGRNSPYAKALIEAIQEPGVRLVDVFRKTRAQVRDETGGSQVPWQSDNLTTEAFYFVPTGGSASSQVARVAPTQPTDSSDFSLDDLDEEANQQEATYRKRQERLAPMERGFSKAERFEKRRVSDDLKVKAWERFLAAYRDDVPGSERDNQLREQAGQRIESLQREYASLVVRSNVLGYNVTIDGRAFGATGPRLHQLDPGRHAVKVEKSGYESHEERIELVAGDQRVVSANLVKAVPVGMVRVPAGEFFSGCNRPVDSRCDLAEPPGRNRSVAAFNIDATEVTVEAYRECVDDGSCSEPDSILLCNWDLDYRESHPINCVDRRQANSYCAWKGKRLPTEWEWEKAARGTDGPTYSWGNERASCRYAVIAVGAGAACGRGQTTFKVASKPAGASPYGAQDMAGNVREWTSSTFQSGSDRGVLRGGSFLTGWRSASASNRDHDLTSKRYLDIGFRCAQ